MRLDFNVLWVEDQPANVTDQEHRISHLIRKHGFRLSVKFAKTVDEAEKCLANDIYGDHIDLVLMDYDLGEGKEDGMDGLRKVRKKFPYKDIIFYSANQNFREIKEKARKEIEGLFISQRTDLPDVVAGVFESLIKKVLDIDHSRGIVMGATSDIDYMIFRKICEIFNCSPDKEKQEIIEKIIEKVGKKSVKFEEDINEYKEILKKIKKNLSDIEHIKKYHWIYTSIDCFHLFKELIENSEQYKNNEDKFKFYHDKIITQRNDLAHMTVEKEGFTCTFFNRKGEKITSEDMTKLRTALLDFQDLLDEI